MSLTIRSHDELSQLTPAFSAGDATPETTSESAKIFRYEAFVRVAPSAGQSIDSLIEELIADPGFAKEMSSARQRRGRALEATDGNTLKTLRLSRGLSQAELAARVGMKQPHIARIERGRMCPTLPTLRRLAEALAVDMNTLDQHLPTTADGTESSL